MISGPRPPGAPRAGRALLPLALPGFLLLTALAPAFPEDAPKEGEKAAGENKEKEAPAPESSKSRRDAAIELFNGIDFFTKTFRIVEETGEGLLFYSGPVKGSFLWERPGGPPDPVTIYADRVLVIAPIEEAPPEKPTPRAEGTPPPPPEKTAPPPPAGKSAGGKKALPKHPRLGAPRLYAEGNVRLESKEVILETDAFFYDAGKKRGVLVGVRGRADLTALLSLAGIRDRKDFFRIRPADPVDMGGIGEPPPSKGARIPGQIEVERVLAFRAEVLHVFDLRHFEGDDVVVTNCDYGVPHVGFYTPAAKIYPVPPGEAEEEEEEAEAAETGGKQEGKEGAGAGEGLKKQHYIVTSRPGLLELNGHPVLPLPPARWDTRWNQDLPIRRIQPGHSSKFGTRLDIDWNVNWFLNRTPLTRLEPARMFLKESRLDFATDHRSARGFGWGPEGLYGRPPEAWKPWKIDPSAWNHYGEAGYYAIHDTGEDRTSPEEFDPSRHWTHVIHRQALPHVGVLDVEFSERSDPNFLNEYFESIAKEEKEQESLFYFRRTFRDNIAVTGLYKYRSDSFETVTERIPEGKLFLLEQPVARTGIYSGLALQGAELRRLDADPAPPSPREGRFDLLNEWSYPFGLGRYLRLRPFGDVRFSEFSRGVDPGEDEIDREAFAAGITASQEYSRIFRFERGSIADRWFGFTQLKHEVIPQVTYLNLYANDVEPSALLPFDEVDTVSTDERIDLSLRNEVLVRKPVPPPRPLAGSAPARSRPGAEGVRPDREVLRLLPTETRSLLDSEVSTDVFTHPARDNGGKSFSPLDVDLTLNPHQRFGLHSRSFFDIDEDLRFERTDSGVTVIPIPEALRVSVGERFTRSATTFTYTQWTVEFSPKYLMDFYYAYDFEDQRQADVEVRLTRIFHRWAMEVVWGIDFGEDDNQSVTVNVEPIELLGIRRRGRDHRVGR